MFGSLTFRGLGFWGFLGWLFVFWRVDVSVFVMLFCENLVRWPFLFGVVGVFLFIGLFFIFERLVDALASCADEGRCGWR